MDLNNSPNKIKKAIIASVGLMVVVLSVFLLNKETVTVSPVKIKLSGYVDPIQLEIKSGNILDAKTIGECGFDFRTKKLSSKNCKEINMMIEKILATDRKKLHKPDSFDISDVVCMEVTIGTQTYINLYGGHPDTGVDDLDWLTHRLLQESPIPFDFNWQWLKFPKQYDPEFLQLNSKGRFETQGDGSVALTN